MLCKFQRLRVSYLHFLIGNSTLIAIGAVSSVKEPGRKGVLDSF
ncbi:Protein of unknown function [Pyronema omphalodes CBS 100304]|uniref:Uncharacterized protein n=1 Tax=Pyronema omphalodes (strain CBS 100304) TaxID=1076935 RepID=U4LDS9_PYROM|nr:Protein of unknown function [Pyronema omphalodes CBS 100304]